MADTGISCTRSPNTRSSALYSAMSPTGVLVACALMWVTSSSVAPACSSAACTARAAPRPSGSGAVMWYESLVTPPPASSA